MPGKGKRGSKKSNRWIWPVAPKSSKCVCPQHCPPPTFGSVFLKSFPKMVFNSCIEQFLSCAVPCSPVYSSQKQLYSRRSHESQLPWATTAPASSGALSPVHQLQVIEKSHFHSCDTRRFLLVNQLLPLLCFLDSFK